MDLLKISQWMNKIILNATVETNEFLPYVSDGIWKGCARRPRKRAYATLPNPFRDIRLLTDTLARFDQRYV